MIPLELLFIPFIGGIIGYSTNWIAIKMLFRPKEAKYFFKIRIPFTPGILPKSKEKLAKKISYTTFHHILSHPILKEKIELKFIEIEHFFTEKLKTIIDNSNPITFYEIIPNRFYPLFIELYSKLNKEFNTVVLSYISSENLLKIFKKDDTFYSKIKVLYFILDNLIDRFNQINFKEYFQKEAKKSKKSISHFLPNSIFIDIKSFLMENYPLLSPFLKNIIISNKLDKKLEEIMEKLILKYLEDSLTSTQKIFSNLFRIEAEIKKKIPEFVQEFLSNLFNTLNEDQIKNHIIDQILDILKNIIDKPFDTFEENIIDNFFQNYIFTFEKKIKYSLIESKNRRRLIFILIRNFFNQNIILKNKQDLNDLISTLFKKKIHYWIFKKDIRNTLSKFENLKISYYLVNTILILIKENQKKLFHLLDLEKNIEATMNDFHMEDIEKIILNIIHNELKWINIFGGIIGFLIGIIQTILAFFII